MSRAQLTSTVEQNTGGAVSPYVAGKNAIINGGMDIWQRGTSSFSIAATTPQYTADRWTCYFNGTGTITQETSVIPSNSKYALRMTATATSVGNNIYQLIETNNALPYAGKAITLSLQLAGTVGISAGVNLAYSTSVDDSLFNVSTSIALTTVTGPTLSNSLQTYVFTCTIPSTAKTLRVGVGTGAAVNTNYLVIANVQLELGSVATPFSRAGGTLSGELAACQRYYYRGYNASTTNTKFAGNGFIYSTTNGIYTLPNPVALRVVPTSVDFTALRAFDITGGGVFNISAVTISADSTTLTTNIIFTIAGATASRVATVDGQSSSAYLGFSAEL